MLEMPAVRLRARDWSRLMLLAFQSESEEHPFSSDLRNEVHRAIVLDDDVPVKDLVTDVSWNYEVKKRIAPFKPRPPDAPDGTWRVQQEDVDRVQEFRKCIECFLCQDVCHVLRDHHLHEQFIGPRSLVYVAALEMHPLDVEDRVADLRRSEGIGYCNITKCCTKVCPEHITTTDNAIIPLKERVVDRYFDPVTRLLRMFKG